MEFLKSLFPNTSSNVVTIPSHEEGESEDDLDLKVRSLTYLFKRLDLENAPPFISENNSFPMASNDHEVSEKLDTIYNKEAFIALVLSNEHRILVDWFKNRFRSLCILSDIPSSTFERKLGRGFRFAVLRPDSSDDHYVDTLVHSDIYVEHNVDVKVKREILKELIKQQRLLRPSYKQHFNRNDRAAIILSYVCKLSEIVQIERIYRASLITKLETVKNVKLGHISEQEDGYENENEELGARLYPSGSLRSSRSKSPVRRYSEGVPKVLTPIRLNSQAQTKLTPPSSPAKAPPPPSSALRSRSSSPLKTLKKKSSMTLLKMDKLSQEEVPDDDWLSKNDMALLRSQAEQAVMLRVEREKRAVQGPE